MHEVVSPLDTCVGGVASRRVRGGFSNQLVQGKRGLPACMRRRVWPPGAHEDVLQLDSCGGGVDEGIPTRYPQPEDSTKSPAREVILVTQELGKAHGGCTAS